MRPKTAALTFVGALVASAFMPGNSVSPVGLLHVGFADQSDMSLADAVAAGPHGRNHPVVESVAPPALLSTAARHLASASAGPKCDDSQVRGNVAKYQGRSVSGIYDNLFQPGMSMPYLDSYIPQALENWTNWDGQGHDLILLGMYRLGHKSYLVGLNPDTGNSVGTVMVDESHLGGMALFGDWLFTGDNPWPHPGSPTVEKYKVSDLQVAMQQAISSKRPVYLKSDGPRQDIDATDFMSVDGDSLYTGNHGNKGTPGLMNRYVLEADGTLKKVEGPWTVPDRAQGLIITPDDFVFSTDNDTGRGELVVVRRSGPAVIKDPVACVWMPAMPEDLTVRDGQVLTVFESGASRFAKDHPVNRVSHLHSGSLDSLLTAVDPVAYAAEKTLGIAPVNPNHPLPTVPSLPTVPTLPVLPGTPAPGTTPILPTVPGLGNLPIIGGLTNGLTTGGTAATAAPTAGPTPSSTPSPTSTTLSPAAGPAPAANSSVQIPVLPTAAPTVTPSAAPLNSAPLNSAPLNSSVATSPLAPVLDPLTPLLTPTPRPGEMSSKVELWLPTQRVSDAFDLYNSQLTKPDVALTPLPGGEATGAPTASAAPTAAAVLPGASALSAQSLTAPVTAPSFEMPDSTAGLPRTQTYSRSAHRGTESHRMATLPAPETSATVAAPQHVSDARDLYDTQQTSQINAG